MLANRMIAFLEKFQIQINAKKLKNLNRLLNAFVVSGCETLSFMFFIKRLYCAVNPTETKNFFNSIVVGNRALFSVIVLILSVLFSISYVF